MSHQVIPAGQADVGTLSQVIADAFHDLPPSPWLISDPAARRRIFPPYFRLYVEHAMANGIVHTTPGRTAVALWLPAGRDGPEPPGDGYGAKLAEITGPWADRFVAFDAALDRHHPTGAAHHHLAILAVRPHDQGRGTGTALLRAHHAALDAAGTPAYLEASSDRNRAFYLRHGYADLGPPICLPDGPRMRPMMRATGARPRQVPAGGYFDERQ